MNKKILLFFAAAPLILTSPAHSMPLKAEKVRADAAFSQKNIILAQQGAGSLRGPFGARDSNGDQKISQDEFLARFIERFESMDKNNDGFLTDQEMNPPSESQPLSAEQKARIEERKQEIRAKREELRQGRGQ